MLQIPLHALSLACGRNWWGPFFLSSSVACELFLPCSLEGRCPLACLWVLMRLQKEFPGAPAGPGSCHKHRQESQAMSLDRWVTNIIAICTLRVTVVWLTVCVLLSISLWEESSCVKRSLKKERMLLPLGSPWIWPGGEMFGSWGKAEEAAAKQQFAA